mgnify:CR=1 FL=1
MTISVSKEQQESLRKRFLLNLEVRVLLQENSRAGSYNYSTGSDDSSTGGDGWSFSWMKETASKNWVTKTIAILAIVAVVFLVLSIIFKLVAILFKPAVVVLAVAAVYYLVKNSSNK